MEQTPIILVDGLKEFDRNVLAKQIAITLGYEYHTGASDAPGYVNNMRAALDRFNGVVICHSWLADQVYFAITSKRRLSRVEHSMLNTIALSRSVVSVVATGELQSFLVGYGMKVSPTVQMIDTAIAVYNEWRGLAPSFPSYKFSFFEFINNPNHHLNQIKHEVERYHNIGPGIGAFYKGRTLIVGSKHGATKQPYRVKLNMPFVSMSGQGCSAWLHAQLVEAKINPTNLYWVNAYDTHGNETSPVFVDFLEPKSIIALGDDAMEWCERHKLRAIKVPHPQYWKRFHHSEVYPLVRLLA